MPLTPLPDMFTPLRTLQCTTCGAMRVSPYFYTDERGALICCYTTCATSEDPRKLSAEISRQYVAITDANVLREARYALYGRRNTAWIEAGDASHDVHRRIRDGNEP